MNRISARQRGLAEVELRRAAGVRAIAALAALGVVAMIALGSAPADNGVGALGLHIEPYGFQVPASVEEEFRRETVAVAPATGVYEEPEMTVHHELHG